MDEQEDLSLEDITEAEKDVFKESNWRLAMGFQNQLDALNDKFEEMADGRSRDDYERLYRIGEWDRLRVLSRHGDEFLSEDEIPLLQEEEKFWMREGGLNFNIETSFDSVRLTQIREWWEATDRDRAIGFGLFVYSWITGGEGSEEESIFLFGWANQYLVWCWQRPVEDIEADFVRKEAERRSDQATARNLLHRHKKTRAARERCVAEWAKDPSKFPSAEKAGRHFADWLVTEGLVKEIEPRTVTGWIRAHAKDMGKRFR